MRQTRKRKRTRVKPGPILVLALIVALAAGLVYSPLTSLSRVTVVGVKAIDRQDIENILGTLNKIPWIMVNPRWVETRVQRIQAVDRASYSQNIFGRGHLVVHYREPVARIKAESPVAIDATGTIFETDSLSPDLPVVIRPNNAKPLPVALGTGFPVQDVASLAVKAKQLAPSDKLVIWFNGEGALCLNIGGGLVILGSSDDLDRKLQTLKDLMDRRPGFLAKVDSLNLTEPSQPAETYKKQRE